MNHEKYAMNTDGIVPNIVLIVLIVQEYFPIFVLKNMHFSNIDEGVHVVPILAHFIEFWKL